MKKYLLPKNGDFYKANLHMHTTISDGKMTPEETKIKYQEKGYSIVAFTDHEVMVPHTDLTDDNFLAITSTEIIINERNDCDFSFTKTYHLNIYSPEPKKSEYNTFNEKIIWKKHSLDYVTLKQKETSYNRRYSAEGINEIIKLAHEENCLVSYNHPVWSLQDYSDFIELNGIWGVEWHNNTCARMGLLDSFQPIDNLLRKGQRVFPLATDDAHSIDDCFGGFVMINADKLEYDIIFDALRKGDFYSSAGPLIYEISIEGGIVNVKCSLAKKIILTTDRRTIRCSNSQNGELINEANFDINFYLSHTNDGINENQYIRITVIDEEGNCAHSRAYFVDEL